MAYHQLGAEEHFVFSLLDGSTDATAILDGMSPQDIPIIANQTWDVWANEALLNAAEIRLPRALRKKAKRVE